MLVAGVPELHDPVNYVLVPVNGVIDISGGNQIFVSTRPQRIPYVSASSSGDRDSGGK